MIPIAFNEKALHLSPFIVVIFFSDSVPCLPEIQSMKYLQLVLQMLPTLPKNSSCLQTPASLLPLSQQGSAGPFRLSFALLLLSFCLPFCPFPSSSPVLVSAPVACFAWQQVGVGSLAVGAVQGAAVRGRQCFYQPG